LLAARISSVRTFGVFGLCLVLGAAACGGAPSAERQPATTEPGIEWTTHDVPGAALVVRYPSSWTRSAKPLMPHLGDPKELIALSTFTARPGGQNCGHMPENALEDMSPADALVVVEERLGDYEGAGTPEDYPGRPARFGPTDGYRSEAVDCLDHRKVFFDRLIPFSDSGRRFYAYVALGSEAPAGVEAQAWAILDQLEIGTRGSTL
jgi:hypothetical protein